jgi:hypothetical protein
MVIALLAVLGVDLVVIVILLASVLSRKLWVSHQPGAFKGAVRIADGEVAGFKTKWKRGYGRWVGNVLVWTKKPFLFRNELVVAEPLAAETRTAEPGEVKRVGKHPVVVAIAVDGGGRMEIATSESEMDRALGVVAAASSVTNHLRRTHPEADRIASSS